MIPLLGVMIMKATDDQTKHIESLIAVQTYLDKLKHIINNNGKINFQKHKQSEKQKNIEFTNLYTVHDLFANQDIVEAIKQELKSLDVSNYLHTVTDIKYPQKPPLWVFCKKIKERDVYIKIRTAIVEGFILVISFHYAAYTINKSDYPYLK